MTPERLLRLAVAGHKLSIRPRTVKDWIRTGKLKGVRLANGHWRVSEGEISRAMKISIRN